jgi:arylsulfatase A-like enzyme
VVPANRVTKQMAITMDWTATMLAVANGDAVAGGSFDGIDLLPVIKGASPVVDRTFFWRIYTQSAVRQGKWKFFRDDDVSRLFDLSVDHREQADFSKKAPAVLERLTNEFDKWNEQMLPRRTAR